MKVGIVIQARTSSTRLPAKVLKDLPWGGGVSVLAQVIRRVKRAKTDAVIVATTVEKCDDPIVRIAKKERAACFRGSRDDVLSRYYLAAKEHELDVVVRITSDCPCADPVLIDRVVQRHLRGGYDYTHSELFPRGLDVEVISFQALERSFREARREFEREHVMPYASMSGHFKTGGLKATGRQRRPDLRITLDTEADYALLCAIFEALYPRNKRFGTDDILRLFAAKPWLADINRHVMQKLVGSRR